jgi:hypothetical protein
MDTSLCHKVFYLFVCMHSQKDLGPSALQFTDDFKLGHYMKIPPRPMFWCQVGDVLKNGHDSMKVLF